MESLVQGFIEVLGSTTNEFKIFIISMLPILELRGGLIAAYLLDVEIIRAFIICFIGNILPIPLILIFIRQFFDFLKRFKIFRGPITWLENRTLKKGKKIENALITGLFLFVAIPLPGTGAWTGALLASLMNMKFKHSFPTIALGVLCAGLIVSILSYGLLGAIGIG